MNRHLRIAKTAEDVIKALGGAGATAQFTGRSVQAVSNWKSANKLPSWSYLTLSKHLEDSGWQASPALWGIVEPDDAGAP